MGEHYIQLKRKMYRSLLGGFDDKMNRRTSWGRA